MQEFVAKVTSKGQMTLPAEVRRRLGVRPGDSVTIIVEGARAELHKAEYSVDSVFGVIPALPGIETGDFDDLIEEAMEDHADWVVARMKAGLE